MFVETCCKPIVCVIRYVDSGADPGLLKRGGSISGADTGFLEGGGVKTFTSTPPLGHCPRDVFRPPKN